MSPGIFGPLITTYDIDTRLLGGIKLWLPTYLTQTERERQLGQGWLARPKTYANVLDDATFLDHVLPAVLVTTSGTVGDPERVGGGLYNVWWHFAVTVILRGPDTEGSRKAASLYGATLRRLLLQKSSLRDANGVAFAGGMEWNSEVVLPVDDTTDKGRNLACAIGDYNVLVEDVVQDMAGPVQPDPETDPHDYGEWPLADPVTVDVVAVPIDTNDDD